MSSVANALRVLSDAVANKSEVWGTDRIKILKRWRICSSFLHKNTLAFFSSTSH